MAGGVGGATDISAPLNLSWTDAAPVRRASLFFFLASLWMENLGGKKSPANCSLSVNDGAICVMTSIFWASLTEVPGSDPKSRIRLPTLAVTAPKCWRPGCQYATTLFPSGPARYCSQNSDAATKCFRVYCNTKIDDFAPETQ